jgi:hypothetical protein
VGKCNELVVMCRYLGLINMRRSNTRMYVYIYIGSGCPAPVIFLAILITFAI